MPFITPETDPPETLCWQIIVPNERFFVMALKERLYSLTRTHNWEKVKPTSLNATEAAAMGLNMYNSLTLCTGNNSMELITAIDASAGHTLTHVFTQPEESIWVRGVMIPGATMTATDNLNMIVNNSDNHDYNYRQDNNSASWGRLTNQSHVTIADYTGMVQNEVMDTMTFELQIDTVDRLRFYCRSHTNMQNTYVSATYYTQGAIGNNGDTISQLTFTQPNGRAWQQFMLQIWRML